MSRTLDEAIRHEMNIAEKQEELAKVCIAKRAKDDCLKCAVEHRQLAKWLKELAERRKQPGIIHCGECAFPYIRGKNMYCDNITGEEIMVWKDEYCSWGEKKHVENG